MEKNSNPTSLLFSFIIFLRSQIDESLLFSDLKLLVRVPLGPPTGGRLASLARAEFTTQILMLTGSHMVIQAYLISDACYNNIP